MTITVKDANDVIVPASVRRKAGIRAGDRLEFRVSGGVINIIPELPTAIGEYSQRQRRAIDARLAEARKGPYYGPFESAEEAIEFLNNEIRTRKIKKRKTA
jgi:AbrB family looped-hinge helix DNA binding protein